MDTLVFPRAGPAALTPRFASLVSLRAGSAGQLMARVYGEPVEVQTTEDGCPARFVWRSRVYTVLGVQEHWVVNKDWWRQTAPVPAQPELQFWRVEAAPGSEHSSGHKGRAAQPGGSYELRRDVTDGAWTLRRIAD